MKYIKNQSYLLLLLTSFFWTACEFGGVEDATPDFQEASMPVITEVNQEFYNLLDLDNAFVNFSVGKLGDVGVESMNVYQTFNGGEPKLVTTVNSLPTELNIDLSDAAQLAGVSPANLVPGDAFVYTFEVVTSDGRTLSSGTNVLASAACPSTIPTGEWRTNVPNPSGGFYVIEIESTGAGTYSVPNMNLDFQPDFYNTFTGLPIGGGFTDACNTVTFNQAGQYGVIWTGTGEYDPETETIIVSQFSDPGYGQGPWDNNGEAYVFTKL